MGCDGLRWGWLCCGGHLPRTARLRLKYGRGGEPERRRRKANILLWFLWLLV
jgi:hypothetical protein